MSIVNEVNEEVMKIWEKWENKLDDKNLLIPLIYPQIKPCEILFIGLNPSYDPKTYKRILKDTEFSSEKLEMLLSWKNHANLDIEKCLAIEEIMINKHPYFSKFRKIAQCTSSRYEHIDLFFYRKTGQKSFEKNILHNNDFSEFVKSQLALSMKLMKSVSPKVIVVANAKASQKFERIWGGKLSLEWNSTCGYHTVKLVDKPVPVFFTSMLTGQRALDNGSYKRLKWHIREALKH